MKVIDSGYEILYPSSTTDWSRELAAIEEAARNCYQSEPKGNRTKFITSLKSRGHFAMFEFGKMVVKFTCDRGVSHEIVRHRLFSFAQESTRYCKYENEITVIKPAKWIDWDGEAQSAWISACLESEAYYKKMLNLMSPQEARAVLNNSLKTSLIVNGNFREWRHFFSLRDSIKAHPDMQKLVKPLHERMVEEYPEIFRDDEPVR